MRSLEIEQTGTATAFPARMYPKFHEGKFGVLALKDVITAVKGRTKWKNDREFSAMYNNFEHDLDI